MLLGANVVIAPLMLVFIHFGGAAGAVALAIVGIAVIGTFGITMVMAQNYLPSRIGMISDRRKYCRKASRAPINFSVMWNAPKAGHSTQPGLSKAPGS